MWVYFLLCGAVGLLCFLWTIKYHNTEVGSLHQSVFEYLIEWFKKNETKGMLVELGSALAIVGILLAISVLIGRCVDPAPIQVAEQVQSATSQNIKDQN